MLLLLEGRKRRGFMIDFYNAFISYKHAPLDIKIASHVQKELEHFHVPHKLKGKIKHEKITRIFRDKDELPITSDLTETLTNALRNSEHLIVICSTNTKESIWVKREIATFLQTHTKDKIFTVLCDGEPQDVIPEELLTADKQIVDANGFTHTVKIPVEPLSCDYRLPMGRADKEELPRLAAGLLGCSYDELQRRNRQYRMRRAAAIIAAAFAGVAAFGVYAFISRQQINKSYVESLRSKSIYLANEATQLLDAGNRVEAIQLALEALPKNKNDKMPVTAPAMRAIIDTTNAYKTSMGMGFTPVWNYTTAYDIELAMLSDNKEHLAVMDKMGNTYCWDTETRELIFEKTVENRPIKIFFLDDDTLILAFANRVEAYNVVAQKNIWTYKITDHEINEYALASAANSLYLDIGEGQIAKISGRDGKVVETYEVLKDKFVRTVYYLTVSEDGKTLAYSDSSFIFSTTAICTYNTETKKETTGTLDVSMVHSFQLIDKDHLLIIASDNIIGTNTIDYGSFKYVDKAKMTCYCYDSQMNVKWSAEIEQNVSASHFGSLALPSRNAVLCFAGNGALICDIDSGKVLNTLSTSSAIVNAYDVNHTGMPQLICRYGEYYYQANPDKNGLCEMDFECNNLNFGFLGTGLFAIPCESNNIIFFDQYLVDDEWEMIKAPGSYIAGTSWQGFDYDDDYLVIAGKLRDEDIVRISIVDLESGKLSSSTDVTLPDDTLSDLDVQLINGEFYAFIGKEIYTVDPKDGSVDKISAELETLSTVSNGKAITVKINSFDNTIEVKVTDIVKNKTKEITGTVNDKLEAGYMGNSFYLPAADAVFFCSGDRLFVADLNKSKIKEVSVADSWTSSLYKRLYVTSNDDGSKILVSDRHTITVMDSSYKELYTVHSDCESRCGAVFKDGILYLCSDNYLSLYKEETGELINRIALTYDVPGAAKFVFNEKAHEVYIQTSDSISIVDTEAWVEIACISGAYCYNAKSDRFYAYSFQTSSQCYVGFFKHYTMEDLVAKAKRFLGKREMDEVTKMKYGL